MRSVDSLRASALAALLSVTSAYAAPQDPEPVDVKPSPELQRRINRAIDDGVAYLLSHQHRDGSWTGKDFRAYKAGPTAFVAYALVESGVRPESPAIVRALDYLRRTPPTMTYSAGSILLLLGEIGDKDNAEWAADVVETLVEFENPLRGTWSYPSGPVDLSNTQFVALGFWGAQKLGVKVPLDVVQRMAQATIEQHQEPPWFPGSDGKPGKRKRGQKGLAGFTYFTQDRQEPPRGSMTAAGVSIHRIARILHGRKLGRRLVKAMDESEERAMAWLGQHWSMAGNPGHPDGPEGQLLYYLYAVERLGAFYDSDTLVGHPWYVPGAETILAMQEADGGWKHLSQTCYALLFLNRATRGPVSGTKREVAGPGAEKQAWENLAGPVGVRATGTMRLSAWLTDVDAGEPFTVDEVEWSLDGEVFATIPSTSDRPWKGERYATAIDPGTAGRHVLTARIKGRKANNEVLVLESGELDVETRWTPAAWQRAAAADPEPNLLWGVKCQAEATSESAGQHPPRAVDGYEGTAWIPGGSDETPTLTVTLSKPVRASAVTLTQVASTADATLHFRGILKVRLTVNGVVSEHTLPAQTPAPAVLPLESSTRVRTIVVELLDIETGKNGMPGIAEIGLR